MSPSADPEDPFDTLLTLEDNLYTTAYSQGTADGARAGRIEGRIFGLEKGFEKFSTLGQLHGRAAVWGTRLPSSPAETPAPGSPSKKDPGEEDDAPEQSERKEKQAISKNTNLEEKTKKEEEKDMITTKALPNFKPNERLAKNIALLHALTDPPTFSTLNTEDAVADFDDRIKRASAKAKIIERIVGETGSTPSSSNSAHAAAQEDPEGTAAVTKNVRVIGGKGGAKRGDDSMEDFVGSRFLR